MSVHDLEVDLDLKQSLNVYAACKQLDNLNLIFNIYDNRVPADFGNYNVRLKALKSDKVPLIQDNNYTIKNNVVTIVCNEQLTTTSGKTLIELQFINKTTGLKKSTFNLVLNVMDSALEVSPSISTATYTLLEELENKLDKSQVVLEQLDKAIIANSELKNTIASGNTTKSRLETDITNGNTLNTSLDSNIKKGTAINSTLGDTINSGNVLKANLDIVNKQAKDNITTLEAMGNLAEMTKNVNNNCESINLLNTKLLSMDNKKANLTDISNQNLLINGDFQVWQRGTTFTQTDAGSIFTSDRYRLYCSVAGNTASVLQVTKGLQLDVTKYSSGFAGIIYPMEEIDTLKIRNKTITMTIDVESVSGNFVGSCAMRESPYTYYIYKENLTVGKNIITGSVAEPKQLLFSVRGLTTGSIVIKSIKVEMGGISTTLSPRTYAEELFLCQRYYQTIAGGFEFPSCYIVRDFIDFLIPLNCQMRVIPTLISTGYAIHDNNNINVANYTTGFTLSVANDTAQYKLSLSLNLRAAKASHGLTNATIYISGAALDAEIY